jgi:polyribonucleotide nucleotidyltransferase
MCCMGRWIIRGFSSRRNEQGDRGPRREREDRPERDDGPEPEFAPAFLTRDGD